VPGLRPTPDRIRETLFNWLQNDIPGARCLDLFAGSGALGLEALSRFADSVLFCDNNSEAVRCLRGNLQLLGSQGAEVHQRQAQDLLRAGPADKPFEIVFLDPPFNKGLLAPCMELLETQGWLAPYAKIYLESESGLTLSLPANWQILREKTAGQVCYRLAQRTTPTAQDANPG